MTSPVDLNSLSLRKLFVELNPPTDLEELCERLRREDLGGVGDVTSRLMIDADRAGAATIVARANGVLAGAAALPALLQAYDDCLTIELNQDDGTPFARKDRLGVVEGSLRSILAVERPLLNLLAHLSGIATLTRRYVRQIDDLKTVICETRKTTPGLRGLEKYATRCGGGTLHRIGLYDAVLIKDNHLAGVDAQQLTQVLAERLRDVKTKSELRFVEVEVDTLAQLDAVLATPEDLIDIILFDNADVRELREAVRDRDNRRPNVLLEASGGVTLDRVRAIAETGVDRISVGALTHGAVSLDMAMDIT